jgi:hypothetical protein
VLGVRPGIGGGATLRWRDGRRWTIDDVIGEAERRLDAAPAPLPLDAIRVRRLRL